MLRKSDHGFVRGGIALAAAVALGLPAFHAMALTNASTTFNVTATVVAACALSATNMAFGVYSGGQLDATSTVAVTCTNGASFQIGLDQGTGAGGTTQIRVMTGPASATLSYGLYQDGSRGSFWGNGAGDSVSAVGTGAVQKFTVYGRMTAGQSTTVGSYADVITATVSY